MKIIPLGIAGFIPTESRETISVLLIIDKIAIIFDCGTGIKRLMLKKIQDELSSVDSVYVFLSHFHMDHLVGLPWLLKLVNKPLHFYVPSNPLIESNGIENINIITNNPFFGLEIPKWPNFGSINSFSNDVVHIKDKVIKVNKQHHSGGSVGFRIDNFSFITDVVLQEKDIKFIEKSDLLLLDTMYDKFDYDNLSLSSNSTTSLDHGYSIGNAIIAKKSNIKQFGLIHLNPLYDSKRISRLLDESKSIFKNSLIPEETDIYSL